ncbi:nuclear transport factor 2 family protein [Spirillospora albida]|uniref:nuclear transport factor 2 family protein n=1 Tax=Spirillospora albida TaxID=58123 RepID=UPI00147039D4|nr:nuclear transport factor 2 family protein [Spirillospora albida]
MRDDRHELTDLVTRLGLWLDEHRFDEARTVFTEDAEARTPGGTARGLDALVRQASRNHGVPTQHFITNPLIEIDGEEATIRANLLVVFAGEGERRVLGERYDLRARRTAAGWRLSRVGVRPIWDGLQAA